MSKQEAKHACEVSGLGINVEGEKGGAKCNTFL